MSDRTWHWWEGPRVYACKVNDVTDRMIRLSYKVFGREVKLTQGSTFGAGNGASASAGTHNGTSVVDFSVIGMSVADIKAYVTVLRKLGFAAWYRPYLAGVWPSHIHAILIQPAGIAGGAINQIASFKRGRTGLVGDRLDTLHKWVGWTTYQQAEKVYANYVRELTKPASTSTKGLFTMGAAIYREVVRKVDLKAGASKTLPINDEGDVTLIIGPTKDFNVNVQLRVEGLEKGETVTVVVYSVNWKKGSKAQNVWESNQVEIVGTGGTTYGQAIFDGNLGTPPKGWSRRLRLRASTSSDGVAITRITTSSRKA